MTIKDLDIRNVTNITLQRGTNYKLHVNSDAGKSSFINITYQKPETKNDSAKVLFYAYNTQTQPNNDKTLFEMSHIDSVLLPESPTTYAIWLGAVGNDFNITIIASNSLRLMSSFAAIALLALQMS